MKEKPRSSTMLRIPEDLKLMAMYAAHDLGITHSYNTDEYMIDIFG